MNDLVDTNREAIIQNLNYLPLQKMLMLWQEVINNSFLVVKKNLSNMQCGEL